MGYIGYQGVLRRKIGLGSAVMEFAVFPLFVSAVLGSLDLYREFFPFT